MKFDVATRCIAASQGQDRVFVRIFDDVAILVVADGSGGRAGGGEASQIVAREASKVAQEVQNPRDADFWVEWLHQVDTTIREDPFAGETTAVIAALGADFVAGASVGDSSIWLIGENNWRDLTEGHTKRPFLGHAGAWPHGFSVRLKGETVLLATDGLTKYADAARLASTARGDSLESAADELIAAVRYPSGSFADDVSCVLGRAILPNSTPSPRKKRFGLF